MNETNVVDLAREVETEDFPSDWNWEHSARVLARAVIDQADKLTAYHIQEAKNGARLLRQAERIAELAGQLERLTDLVRHQRQELFEAELISEEEYASLVAQEGAVARLETYDELRERVAELERQLEEGRNTHSNTAAFF